MVCSGEMMISNRLQDYRHDTRCLFGIPSARNSLAVATSAKKQRFPLSFLKVGDKKSFVFSIL
jgi:hypothetical protein